MAEPGLKPMPSCSRMYAFPPVLKIRESEESEGGVNVGFVSG